MSIECVIEFYREPLLDKLLRKTDDYEIYSHFIGHEMTFSETVSSPLRDDDLSPSFGLFVPSKKADVRPDEIWYKDIPRNDVGNVFKFVKKYAKFNDEIDLKTFRDIVLYIDESMDLGIFNFKKFGVVRKPRKIIARDTDIFFKARFYTAADRQYWARYHVITESILRYYKVYSVGHLLCANSMITRSFKRDELCFAYVVHDKVKLYQPDSEMFKFRGSCPTEYFFGIEQLKPHKWDTLIITKSLKDLMCFKGIVGADVVAPQSETAMFPDDLIKQFKKLYKRVIVVMDYDPAGIAKANQLKKHFQCKYVSTDQSVNNEGKLKVKDKDLSDYLEVHGVAKAVNLLYSWGLSIHSKWQHLICV